LLFFERRHRYGQFRQDPKIDVRLRGRWGEGGKVAASRPNEQFDVLRQSDSIVDDEPYDAIREARWGCQQRAVSDIRGHADLQRSRTCTEQALPVDLLKERQAKITTELADAHARGAAIDVRWETIRTNLKAAYRLACDVGQTYAEARPAWRRMMNQALLTVVNIDCDDPTVRTPVVRGAELAPPFDTLLDDAVRADLTSETGNPRRISNGGV
jgi:hypothetical protein